MEQLTSRVVYRNPWMVVREDEIERADGSPGTYGVVEKPDFAVILPRTENGFWLVEQYRYPISRRVWEFPQGSWSHEPQGDQAALARRELAEETGLRAASLTRLGHLFAAYGYSTQGFDVYLATDLTEGEPDREASELDMTHRAFTDAEISAMISRGAIVDASSLAALILYRLNADEGL